MKDDIQNLIAGLAYYMVGMIVTTAYLATYLKNNDYSFAVSALAGISWMAVYTGLYIGFLYLLDILDRFRS